MKKIELYLAAAMLMIILPGIVLPGCKKYNTQYSHAADTMQLITDKAWTLLSYGYDHNSNGQIDYTEETIDDCQKKNTYRFYMNGTGSVSANTALCGSEKESAVFNWHLAGNKKILDFVYGSLRIMAINSDSLILADTTAGQVHLRLAYRH